MAGNVYGTNLEQGVTVKTMQYNQRRQRGCVGRMSGLWQLTMLIGLVALCAGCIPDSNTPPVPTTAADLAKLELSAGAFTPTFSGATVAYTLTVGNGVASTMVTATPVTADATLQINNQAAQAGQAFGPVPLNVGSNSITIIVTPHGSPSKSYTIAVTRSANVNLSNLSLSAGPLSPAFSSDRVSYSVAAPNQPGQTTITAMAELAGSTITIGGATAISGQPFGPLPLNVGPNTFDIVVRAPTSGEEKKYTVVVTRALSGNANLATLAVSPGTLTPGFDPDIISYSVPGISIFTPSVTVLATVQEATSTLTINGQAVPSGQALAVPVPIGTTKIPVAVRAQDTVTVKTYTITVSRCLFGFGTC